MVLPLIARGIASVAAKKAAKKGTESLAEKQVRRQAIDEVAEAEAKNAAARKAALESAVESTEQGVKVTKYPYAGKRIDARDATMKPDLSGEIPMLPQGRTPPKYAKGGKVDGCAQRGKTKCRMV